MNPTRAFPAKRFGIVGASPQRVSKLGRLVIETLQSAGVELALWIEGDPEPAMPWDLDQPGVIDGKVPTCKRDQAAKQLAKTKVDFLLQLDLATPDAAWIDIGVWRFATPGPGPLAFWEVYDGLYHMEIRLDRLTADQDRTIALDRRWIRVERLSYAATLHAAIEEMAEMAVYVSRCGGSPTQPIVFPPLVIDPPSTLQRLTLKARQAWRLTVDQWNGILFSESWKVGIIEAPVTEFLDLGYLPQIRWLPPPSGTRFIADPFLVKQADGWLLLAEEFDFNTNLGHIAHEASADGRFTGKPPALLEDSIVEPCHMSYPFPLEHEGKLYCIPETHQLNGVFAWRWESGKWVDRKPILTGRALIDPTLVQFEGRWWLFATDKENGVDSKLHIFYAASPWGPWQEHSLNPVKVDIRGARPGGMPFVHEGKLYRPAQDSSKHYGWRLVINQVTKLSPTEFEEEVIRVVDSDRMGAAGVHTLSAAGGRVVIDAWWPRLIPSRVARLVVHKLQRGLGRK